MDIAEDRASATSTDVGNGPVGDPWPCVLDDGDGVEALAGCPIAVAAVDADGTLVWANTACRLLVPGLRAGRALAAQCGLDLADTGRLAEALAGVAELDLTIETVDAGRLGVQARLQALRSSRRLVWLTPVERLRRTEAELQRLNELLRLACNIGRLGVWERDLVTGRGRWDERVFRTRGLEGEGDAPTFDDAAGGIVESDLPAFEAAMRQSLQAPAGYAQRPHWRIRYRIRGHDGVVRPLHKQWFVQHGPDGRPLRMVGLVMDDSDAVALMRTRDDSVSQLALATDLTGLAVWRHDFSTGLVALSPQAFTVFDLAPRPDALPIESLRSLLHPVDRVRAERSVQDALAGGPPADDEVRLRRRDGQWRTLVMRRAVQRDAAGQPQATVGVAIDVTERLGVTRRAAELGRRFQLAIDAAGIGYWTFDARAATAHWSAPLRRMHGLPANAPVPGLRRWLAASVHPADRAATRRRIVAWLRTGRGQGRRLDIDVRVLRPDGGVREMLMQVVVEQEGTDGDTLFGLVLDVTERRMAEAARRDRERALRESEAKSRFLSRMNHELRTPLNAVLGFAHLLLDEETGSDPAAVRRYQRITHIRSAGRHLLELINGALDLSSLEGGEASLLRQPVALATLVAETLPLVEALCVELGVRIDATGVAHGTALGDPTRLRQVLLNLLSNAVKYNRPGGSVRIEAAPRADGVVLRVADTGRGMTPQQLRHLFEPFNRLGIQHEGIEGSGIGLTIVKSLTERMGGSVHVQSEAGAGSVFELHLPGLGTPEPMPTAPPGPPTRPVRAGAPNGAGPRTLLYIEDDPVNVILVTALLGARSDLLVQVASDGASGLELARRLQPGLILLDMHLPGLDGLEVLRRLRADPLTARLPVIGLSANTMRQDIDRARAAGIDDYWSKPLDHVTFRAALDERFGLEPRPPKRAGG